MPVGIILINIHLIFTDLCPALYINDRSFAFLLREN